MTEQAVDQLEDLLSDVKFKSDKGAYKLVLLDYEKPSHEGATFAKSIRTAIEKKRKSSPFICCIAELTDDMSDSSLMQSYESSIDKLLFKPVTKAEVEKIVN